MSLPDFLEYELFNQLRRLMNASLPEQFLSGYTMNLLTRDDLDTALESAEGISVDDISDVKVLVDGTLSYQGRRVLLYIRDKWVFPGQNLPKFHLANCKKLEEMKASGRFERYVISTRTDGKFKINFMSHSGHEESMQELKVCKFCLARLEYKGYSLKNKKHSAEVFQEFSLDQYFHDGRNNLFSVLPTHTEDTAPLNHYGLNFREISTRHRAGNGWICENEKCGVDLSHPYYRKYLHTHHANAQKNDDRRENHKALCIRCHAEEPMHEHLKHSPVFKKFMTIYPGLLQAARRK